MSLLEDPLPLEPGDRSVATTHWWVMEWAGCVWATMLVIPIGLVLIIAPHVLREGGDAAGEAEAQGLHARLSSDRFEFRGRIIFDTVSGSRLALPDSNMMPGGAGGYWRNAVTI